MTVKDWLLPEFDHEIGLTRAVLERAPGDAWTWTPHARSYSLGALATHLVRVPGWSVHILSREFHDLASADPTTPPPVTPAGEILAAFDRTAGSARRALVDCADVELSAVWSLRRGTRVIMSMPRFAALRRFVLNHLVHHRGQMTVYLRLRDQPVPPLYGPSADESM